MTAINVVTAICFALLTISLLYVIVSVVHRKRADRITFIRGFKKGKCVAIFLIAVPLLCLGYIYDGAKFFESFLNAIAHVVDFVVLKFNISKVNSLIEANLFYKITVYYCCVLVILNAILFAFSFIGQQIWLLGNKIGRLFTRKEKLFIFGINKDSISIYKSSKDYNVSIIDNISKNDGFELYKRKIKYISRDDYNGFIGNVIKYALKSYSFTVVINEADDESNLVLLNIFSDKINQQSDEQKNKLFKQLRIYVFGNPQYEAIYEDIVSASHGCIRYRNKYRMLAMDFIDKYPFTKFMNESHIDYATSLIKPEVDINVCMIGFGKPNQQIFLTSVANNQFLTETKNGVDLKQVNYHIYDKDVAENNKNLNHLYYRLKNECQDINPNEYLPLPAFPAKEIYHRLDINSPDFYNSIREIISMRERDVNIAIVSFESDLENIDMAQKLIEKRREWGAENLIIFVRTKDSHADHFIFREKNIFFVGNESECAYNIDRITNDKFSRMAQMRNEIYDLEYEIKKNIKISLNKDAALKNHINANRKWFLSKSQLERESSLYCCLSLQSKLNLMGLEFCKIEDNNLPAMTEEEYLDFYAGTDMPDIHSYGVEADGKKIIKYNLNFPDSRRKNLAILEHQRWNSFMISKGMVPASKEQILNETTIKKGEIIHTNGKNYHLRRHGNLTTFDGLVTFRQMIAERDNVNELDCDVIKYDYQILDDAHWLLTKNGYKIVRR